MIRDMIFNPLTFNPSIWVKALEIAFEHSGNQLPEILGKIDVKKQCYWIASATHAIFNKIGISSILTGGSAAWRYDRELNQTLIYTNWCVNLPSPGKAFEGHCWVETNDYIVDFCDFWAYKEKNEDYKPTAFFTRKDQLLTLDDITFSKKEGYYYSSIPEFIKSVEFCHEAQDKKYLEIISQPIVSAFTSLFINFSLYMYLQYSEEYLIDKTI